MKFKQLSLKLDSRNRLFLLIMVFVLATVIYYRGIYSPRASRLNQAKERYLALSGEAESLESSMLDVESEQEKLQGLKQKYDGLSIQVQEAEKPLPKNIHISDILDFLVKDKEKYNLEIRAISSRKDQLKDIPLYKPPAGSQQKPVSYYAILPIEIEAFGSFDNIIA